MANICCTFRSCTLDTCTYMYIRTTCMKITAFHLFWTCCLLGFCGTPYSLYWKRAGKHCFSLQMKRRLTDSEGGSTQASIQSPTAADGEVSEQSKLTRYFPLVFSHLATGFSRENFFCLFWIWLPLTSFDGPSILYRKKRCVWTTTYSFLALP